MDVAGNCVTAGASLVEITIQEAGPDLTITIADNGCGMAPDFLERVMDPFTTTRTTRKVGMGLPLFKMACEMTGGSFHVDSTVGVGTTVTARFAAQSIDTPPIGDMAGTMFTLISGAPNIDFCYIHTREGKEAVLDTREIRAELEDVPLDTPEVLVWIQESIKEAEEAL